MRALVLLALVLLGGCTIIFGDPIADRACKPITACSAEQCGTISDGCNGTLDCGDTCSNGEHCGGGGANLCGTSTCTPKSCEDQHVTCGQSSDQCSMVLTCGGACGGSDGGTDDAGPSDLAGTFALTVVVDGAGSGTIVSSPAGINCTSGSCVGHFPMGTSVTLTGTAELSSTLSWSDACTNDTGGESATCLVAVDAPTTVTATFDLYYRSFLLDWKGSGDGSITVQPGGAVYYGRTYLQVVNGSTITMTASPASGATFVGWTGDACSGTGTCTQQVIMDDDFDGVTATFTDGTGLVSSSNYGNTGSSRVLATATDSTGALIVTGFFTGTVSFGGSDLTAAGSEPDLYVAKFSSTGAHVWSKRYDGDDGAGYYAAPGGKQLVTDSAGNIYLSGLFATSLTFSSGAITSGSNECPFIAKLTSAGTDVWAKAMPYTNSHFNAARLTVDPAGNVYAVGSMTTSADLGGGTRSGGAYLVKYDTTGAHQWSKGFLANYQLQEGSLAVDGSGNLILGGSFTDTANLGGSDLVSAGDQDWLLASFASSTGAHQWSKSLGSDGRDVLTSLAVDSTGIVMAGGTSFATTASLGGGAVTLGADQASPLLIAKYSLTGAYAWGKVVGESASIDAIALDASSNIYAIGSAGGALDFGDGVQHAGVGFVTKLDASGTAKWTRHSDAIFEAVVATSTQVIAGGSIWDGDYLGTTKFTVGTAGHGDNAALIARFSP